MHACAHLRVWRVVLWNPSAFWSSLKCRRNYLVQLTCISAKLKIPKHAWQICEWMWLLIEKQENASVFTLSFKTLDFEDTLRKLASQKTPSIAHPLGHPSSQTAGSGAWNPLPDILPFFFWATQMWGFCIQRWYNWYDFGPVHIDWACF